MDALGEAAIQLPWLSPCAASLVALARAPAAEAWVVVRTDPGCVLLLLRHALPQPDPTRLSLFPTLLRDPAPLEAARCRLEYPGLGYADWGHPVLRPIYQSALYCARLAQALAERAGRCPPDHAWVCGLLAPLGWLAASAADSERLRRGWEEVAADFDSAAVARRLNRLWQLPPWVGAVSGHLALPADTAESLGADTELFRVAQLAVGLARQRGRGLNLAVGAAPTDLAAALDLAGAQIEAAVREAEAELERPSCWEAPARVPLLPELLALAAENRRVRDWPSLERLQQDIDTLQAALEQQRAGEEGRLQTRKLAALAELAAGAGHEINNPLAVISGQAQYLLGREEDPARQRSLQTIVNQATRIHQTLTDLMQFARPPVPRRQAVDAGALLREVAAALAPLADQRRVRLVCTEPPTPVTLYADPAHTRTALRCLLRNAVEAAPPEGWAGVRVETGPDTIILVVEDSGPGLSAADREHLFDPFYCGRKAGRGRGLGLPTAWRLAREHGGDVHHEPRDQGPTRFDLRLPALAVLPSPAPAAPPGAPALGTDDHAVPAA